MNEKLTIISLNIHAIPFAEAMTRVVNWAKLRQPSYVCFANVHMVMEATDDAHFATQVNNASLVLPDGKPLAMACNLLHKRKQERVAGMDFMPRILAEATTQSLSVFLYGSTEHLLAELKRNIQAQYPLAKIAGAISPPFRQMTEIELDADIRTINDSGAQIVMVSLGCPKQEKWMAINSNKINAVLLGLGGAFAVVAGSQTRAPGWMQRSGLEWLYRLGQEPRRLFKRYFSTNSRFMWLIGKSLLKR
ncbi:MAG: WecB/TagA/CpsF family glycosyltransferase [Chitinophagaceae bacterium]|nr:WecB/TagA/CpsF family glycosyltransferase [Chitinophagaceae bacterium]